MPERRTQEERRAETRRKLLDATIKSLVDGGYPATTGRRVAAIAGVSRGAQTHHFPQMSDLVSEAVEHLADRRSAELRRAAQALRGRDDRIPALVDLLWDDYTGDLFRAVVKLWIAADDDPQLSASLAPVERYVRVLARTVLAEVMTELAPIDDAPRRDELVARLDIVVNAVRGLAVAELFEPRREPPGPDRWQVLRPRLIALLESQ